MPSITLTFDAANATRLQNALTGAKGLEQPATAEDLKDYIISNLKQMVRLEEERVAYNAAVEAAEAPPDVT